jgi:hypothetical protein
LEEVEEVEKEVQHFIKVVVEVPVLLEKNTTFSVQNKVIQLQSDLVEVEQLVLVGMEIMADGQDFLAQILLD